MVARPPDPRQHQLVKARGVGDIELAAKLDRRKPFRGLLASDAIIAEQGIFIFDEFTGNQQTAIGEKRSQFTRSEETRVGEECVSTGRHRGSPDREKKKKNLKKKTQQIN